MGHALDNTMQVYFDPLQENAGLQCIMAAWN